MATTHFFRMMAVAATLFLSLRGTSVVGVAATTSSSVAVQTTPPFPLVDVVFLATTSAGTDKTLYVSTTSDCKASLTPICTLGRSQAGLNYNDTTCLFNITGASVSVDATTTTAIPALYWCSSASGNTSFTTLQMNKVVTTPSYAYLNTETTLHLNAATPVGTTVGLYTTSACTIPLKDTSTTTVESSRELSVNVGTRGITYLCASVPSVLGDTSVLTARTIIYGTNSYDIYTTQGIRHRAVTITADATFLYLSLSTDPQCITLAQDYQQTSSGNAVLTIDVPRGTYYFCAIMSAGVSSIGVFVPAVSTFEVHEYGVQPQTMYANRTTTMSFAMDAVAAAATLQAALFSTSACSTASGTQLTPWSATMEWTVHTAGTFYACVRTGSSTTELGYVNRVVVSATPTVTLSRTPGIMGLGEVATVARRSDDPADSAILTVGISRASDCDALLQSGNTTATGTTASFYIPENSPSTVFLCVSNRLTTDKSNGESSEATTAVYYNLGSLILSTYSLSYPALRTDTSLAIGLDNSVEFRKNTYMYLAPALISGTDSSADDDKDATCKAAIEASNETMSFLLSTSDFKLTPVQFPSAGSWLLCVQEEKVLSNAPVLLRTLTVYGNATVTPSGVLPGIPASLSVTAIPASTSVSLTDGSACSPDMNTIASATSSLTGAATLSFTYGTKGALLLCVGYRGESNSRDTAPVLMTAGEVKSTAVRVMPPVAVAATRTSLTFSAPGAPTLNRLTALLVPGGTAASCPASATSDTLQLPITGHAVVGTTPANEVATATFSPDSSAVGTTYLVCVGTSGNFLSAGVVSVVAVPSLAPNPAPMAYGLPARVTFPAAYVAALAGDVFVMLSESASCTQDLTPTTRYASGAMNVTSGTTDAFFVPSLSSNISTVRFCVAQESRLVNSTLGYADAGTATLAQFTAVTQYAQRQRTNTLVVSPEISGASLYLVRCEGAGCAAATADATCASTSATQYTTSSTEKLTAPVGTYVLCQSVSSSAAVVGSSTTVQVIDPYVMTTTADTSALRAYVPFTVTMSGGPAATSGTYTVTVQPASVACSETAADSQRFAITGGRGRIAITGVTPAAKVHFCVRPSSVDGFEVMTAYLAHYMAPAAVIAGVATTLTSAAPADGAHAKLAATADCSGSVVSGGVQPLQEGKVTFTVDGCNPQTGHLASLYYCETNSAGTYESRGAVGILRDRNCSGGESASIGMVYAAPGTAIGSYGLASSFLTNPRLSLSADCTNLVDGRVGTTGYAPGVDEAAAFYVCAQVLGAPTLIFTTAIPTLTVRNWAVSPSAALSRFNATMGVLPSVKVTVNWATPSTNTFFSTTRDCSESLATASSLSTPGGVATYRTVGVSGLVYVCTTDLLTERTIAVARFLSVTPPSVPQAAPAIVRGGTYTATLVVPGSPPPYSMQPGADASYPYHSYYTSSDRTVFLSADKCVSVISGVTTTTADSTGRVSFVASGIAPGVGSVALCAGTAAGTAVTISSIVVAPGKVYPTQFVSGVWKAAIYVPTYPRTVFELSRSSGDCTATSGMPTFTTDGEGYSTVNLVTPKNNAALAVGTYTLCASVSPPGLTAIDTIEVIDAAFFGIRGTTFVLGVPSAVELLQDLVSNYLYTGFSESRECTSMTSAYGSWSSVTDTSIQVIARRARSAGLYFCAQSQQNNSLIALPASTVSSSGLRFTTSSIVLPRGEWDACSEYTLDQCIPPGSSAASSADVLAMVYGDCCSSARHVVGQSSMRGGTCRLTMDYDAVKSHGTGALFNLCVLNSGDDSVCTTVASSVAVGTSCTPASKHKGLSGGALAGAIVGSVVGGLVLLTVLGILIWFCCCRKSGKKDVGSRELVAFQQFAEDDNHLVGYLIGGRHPLLYYPSGSHIGRSVSPSPPYPSTSSGGYSAVEEMEEEGRDQIALQEARARYNFRLHFSETLQQLAADAKNAAVDGGLDTTWASGDSYLHGVAQPVRRCVESIITESGEADYLTRIGPPAASAAPHHDDDAGSAAAAYEVPEERDLNLTADGNASFDVDPITGRVRKVRSHSIESAPRPPPSATESYLTNDDCEEREEGASAEDIDIDAAHDASALKSTAPLDADGGCGEADVVRRRMVVRRFVNPSSVKSRRRRSQHRDDSRGRPHLDPTHLAAETQHVSQEELLTPVQETVSVFAAATPEAGITTPDVRPAVAARLDESANESAVLARSPITSLDAHDLSEGALTIRGIGGGPATAAAAHERHDSDDAEDGDDLLSFTTTQRFHDETRFLLEQEDGRRQRLCNWEEEERAQLGQAELSAYMALPTLPAGIDEADGAAGFAEAMSSVVAVADAPTSGVASNSMAPVEKTVGEEEQVRHAPCAPTALPSLPPAPRPQALQNPRFHVVATAPE
ncbi:putative mitochondrial hypothetical protein [Leptomonas pyrrhocoris]|uniref:Membrane-associated protein n=1 Tax=Leptomonas pyrrhocoris TaxID=157538 RepID=A0A0N0VCZ7_LEPPY|nr:putative mitochondrial hypothetical protein [Leptomonas pyrrhocoris]KPA74278.1 putative mitochondrial hypothetical protein [Leptomonas pyrrhocoris]|eukprot:XP_015652717.1 putative mitochondrial hypothetical protein [Leptomonas pyrrhocoris]